MAWRRRRPIRSTRTCWHSSNPSQTTCSAFERGATMSLGLTIFTIIHVVISLIGIFSGFVVLAGLLTARRFDGWTAIFLSSTVLTSVSGFFFPVHHFMPSHGVGILSLLLLPVAIYARYGRKLDGH